MLRRSHILTTAAFLAVCATPASAATWEQLHGTAPPPSSIAASQADEYQDLRSPDARDAARDLPSAPAATHAGPGPYTDSERALVESPEVQQMVNRIGGELSASSPVVAVSAPSGGFDWGDAGIGAGGMVALFSIAAGSTLLLIGRRRRHGFRAAH
jgi:hypothetical protein